MRQVYKTGVLALLVLALTLPYTSVRGDEGTASASRAKRNAPPAEALRKQLAPVIAGLGDADFGIRNAAQKQLDVVGSENIDALRELAGEATDVEVKAQLLRRVDEMEVQLAVQPPLISLNARDATMPELCAALKSVGVPFREVAVQSNPVPRFTLDVMDQSFVHLFEQLNKQHPLQVGMLNDELRVFVALQPQRMSFGPNAVFVQDWGKRQLGARTDEFELGLGVLIDPRVRFTIAEGRIERAEDESGNRLVVRDTRDAGPAVPLCRYSMIFTMAKSSRQVAVVKGTLKATVTVREETVDIVDLERHLNEKITLGKGATITITSFKGLEDRVEVRTKGPAQQEIAQALSERRIDSRDEWMVTGRIVDADGKMVVDISETGWAAAVGPGVAKLPLKMQLVVPVKTVEVLIPFELRNIEAR